MPNIKQIHTEHVKFKSLDLIKMFIDIIAFYIPIFIVCVCRAAYSAFVGDECIYWTDLVDYYATSVGSYMVIIINARISSVCICFC